jgi:N-hydroxyarylamine O-acetyltransferase
MPGHATINLDAYFRRIGYSGDRKPTLATLRELHRLQPATIAFENLSPLLGHPVPIDAASLHTKMVADGRGGYCYEQNLLLGSVLDALGFKFRHLTGWPRWQVAPGRLLPRTHLLLLITIDGEDWLADVGFGGNTLTAPLRLDERGEQPTPHEPARLSERDGFLVIQPKIKNEWHDLVAFGLERQNFAELEMGNWFTSTHPKSRFRNELFLARSDAGVRYGMLDNVLTIHRLGGASERRVLANAGEIRDAISDVFHVQLPGDPNLGAMLGRLAEKAA